MANGTGENSVDKVALLVDSMKVNRVIIASLLQKRGWRVVLAENCSDAVGALMSERIDLLIRSPYTTSSSGLDFSTLVTDYEKRNSARLPLIDIETETESSVSDNGANGSLRLPLSEKNLDAAIASIGLTNPAAENLISLDEARRARVSPVDRPQVLVVDDTPENLDYMSRVLSKTDVDVSLAKSGREAMELIEGGCDFTLIFLDIQMPEMSGYDTLNAIRKLGLAVPVIALTAMDDSASNDRHFQEAGFDQFLSKPVMINDVISTVNTFVHGESADLAG